MTERTEEQKLTQEPLRVVLGGKQREVPLLVIREARIWRQQVARALVDVRQQLGVTADNPEAFAKSLTATLNEVPDKVAELFFSYARGLNREEIEATATDKELAVAFSEVLEVAFPLIRALLGTLTKAVQ